MTVSTPSSPLSGPVRPAGTRAIIRSPVQTVLIANTVESDRHAAAARSKRTPFRAAFASARRPPDEFFGGEPRTQYVREPSPVLPSARRFASALETLAARQPSRRRNGTKNQHSIQSVRIHFANRVFVRFETERVTARTSRVRIGGVTRYQRRTWPRTVFRGSEGLKVNKSDDPDESKRIVNPNGKYFHIIFSFVLLPRHYATAKCY